MKKINKSVPKNFFSECLSKDEAKKVKVLDYKTLLDVDSRERIDILSKAIGEEKAKWLNSKIEKDFILKNQKEGLLNHFNKKNDIKDKFKEDIVVRINNLEKPLYNKELDDFIKELASLSLGIGITLEESMKINELYKKLDEAKSEYCNGGSKINHETAQKSLDDYVEELKNS